MSERNSEIPTECLGWTTVEALKKLHDEIDDVLLGYEKKFEQERIVNKFRSAFFQGCDCPLTWFPISATIFVVISLLVTSNYFSGLVLATILTFSLWFTLREYNLRQTEIFRKVRNVLNDIDLAKELCIDWRPFNYPHLCSPLSPCVALQWTYRDGVIVNLPWALIVRGDFIVLRPGQISPGKCSERNSKRKFKCGETYGLTQSIDPPHRPTARSPLPDLVCVMESTPYLENLRTSLDNFLTRPSTISNQQRQLLINKCVQQYGVLIIWIVSMCSGAIYYFDFLFVGEERLTVLELFVELPAITLIPILPLIFPLIWILLNLWGTARLDTLLSVPDPIVHSDHDKSFQEDLDTPTFDWEHASLPTKQIVYNWFALLQGNSDLLARSTNIVQIFGSITALCCIDKKGILSWPNPTAEKIFFLRDSTDMNPSEHSDETDFESDSTQNMKSGTIAEVLDLTHDQHCPFKLEFDDHEWKNHINSLKPLGLAILVNTCCPLTQAHYAKFCGHVTAVAMLDKDLVPVTNRYAIVESSLNSFMHGRCLCELAKQIGFTEHARQIFHLEGQIASYRHLQPEVVKRDIRFARSLHLAAKVKVPFPHSLSVVMRETHDGSLQLLTQGTADLILDCCDDFWDGKDLRPLGQQERKRAQEFYQRSALTAYCTAFAYRPLRHGISGVLSGKNRDIAYLELPPETKTPMEHVEKMHCDFEGHHPKLNHSISTDSLLFSENKEDDIADVEGCFEMQCHQVFIGMVTMQYQAQNDIVQLVERLDRACIRFVHFSKENELRSRVFSEKMGLESGWNCHISLLSEELSSKTSPKNSRDLDSSPNSMGRQNNPDSDSENDNFELNHLLPPIGLESTKTLSSSAPGAISNQETSLNIAHSSKNNSIDSFEMKRHPSKDSAMDCQTQCDENQCRSLSCLTDSTEQSAPVHFDMSNRAKLPRGIENILPHLENVDNVPLLVSLFTDCSAGATREMLRIMQQYGEIVVCLGASASNSNAEIFLQADCSVAIEPLYPQICQDFPSYTESNIFKNKLKVVGTGSTNKWLQTPYHTRNATISPIYLSRMLNSIACSISVCRDDPISLVALVELSRRFTLGLWNCIQFWVCCGCALALMNTVSSCLALPPMLTPISLLYLMCIAIPIIAVPLSRIPSDSVIMKRATGKKQTSLNSNVIIFVIWCYGGKFIAVIATMALSYSAFLSHPINILRLDEKNFDVHLNIARIFILFSVVIHFLIVSISFVHREYSIWKKNPFTNYSWIGSSLVLLLFHCIVCLIQIAIDEEVSSELSKMWPIILFLLFSTVITFSVTELCKLEEIKANIRYQRRARLDFGTKLGMNSPF